MQKQAIVIHSGGLDSSLCLALAIREFGAAGVLSLSFNYGQRHAPELDHAAKICRQWQVDHVVLSIDCLQEITTSALIGTSQEISHQFAEANTLVVGRNGLMARLGAIHAENLGAHCIYMGIIEVDAQVMGYRDCTRAYMDLEQAVLRLDIGDPSFEIRTPLVYMTKQQTLELSYQLGILDFLLCESVSCYEGIPRQGCGHCPTCKIRHSALEGFLKAHPAYQLPYLP